MPAQSLSTYALRTRRPGAPRLSGRSRMTHAQCLCELTNRPSPHDDWPQASASARPIRPHACGHTREILRHRWPTTRSEFMTIVRPQGGYRIGLLTRAERPVRSRPPCHIEAERRPRRHDVCSDAASVWVPPKHEARFRHSAPRGPAPRQPKVLAGPVARAVNPRLNVTISA